MYCFSYSIIVRVGGWCMLYCFPYSIIVRVGGWCMLYCFSYSIIVRVGGWCELYCFPYRESIQRYGKSPYLYPLYGLGELPQGFARWACDV